MNGILCVFVIDLEVFWKLCTFFFVLLWHAIGNILTNTHSNINAQQKQWLTYWKPAQMEVANQCYYFVCMKASKELKEWVVTFQWHGWFGEPIWIKLWGYFSYCLQLGLDLKYSCARSYQSGPWWVWTAIMLKRWTHLNVLGTEIDRQGFHYKQTTDQYSWGALELARISFTQLHVDLDWQGAVALFSTAGLVSVEG